MAPLQTLSDEQLVELVCTRNREAYRYLVDRYQAKLMRYATYLLTDHHRATDVVQETFIKAFINLRGFNRAKKFSSWIYRIAHNEAINSAKKYRREVPLDPAIEISPAAGVEEQFSRNEIAASAHRCLSQMPLIYSEPLSLYYLEDKSYTEISDILRLPVGTVGTRINRAKIIMKRLCQKKI